MISHQAAKRQRKAIRLFPCPSRDLTCDDFDHILNALEFFQDLLEILLVIADRLVDKAGKNTFDPSAEGTMWLGHGVDVFHMVAV
jgi:hypothetical protein